MSRPKLLDLYCCQGGASEGYVLRGFEVFGVDNQPQPRYPFPFHQGDALDVLRRLIAGEAIPFQLGAFGIIRWMRLEDFDAIHASPPCQLYSLTHRINKSDFPDLIGPTRELLELTGLPYVIENVMDAASELIEPGMLCGEMFGIATYRHRLFESNVPMEFPEHPEHVARTAKMGRPPKPGEYMHVVGNFSGVDRAREVMGMSWASRDGLREAIPPVYSEYIGGQLLRHVRGLAA